MDDHTNNTLFVNSTACTTACTTDGTLSFTSDNSWFPYYDESTWLPYHETKYTPKWHIIQGYKNQFKSMWD
jgi:hypothetical protein